MWMLGCRTLTGRLSALQSAKPVVSPLAQGSAAHLSWQRPGRLPFRGLSGSEQPCCALLSLALTSCALAFLARHQLCCMPLERPCCHHARQLCYRKAPANTSRSVP